MALQALCRLRRTFSRGHSISRHISREFTSIAGPGADGTITYSGNEPR
jgi:hypothetical protein